MKGKCGICGDAYDANPRPNEWPGDYARGIITERYTAGDVITVEVDVTANHGGYFEFRLCPLKSYMMEATQACLDRILLQQPDGSTKYHVDQKLRAHVSTVRLRLPKSVTCDRCVLQWKWNTANSWGCMVDSISGNKTCCVGCGQQEQFVNCADVSITGRSGFTKKQLPPIVRMDIRPHKGWKPTAIFGGPKTVKKTSPAPQPRQIPAWISLLSPKRLSGQTKQPFQFNPLPPTKGSPIVSSIHRDSPFSRFNSGPNLQKGFVVGIPARSLIITNPVSGPQPSMVVPKARPRGFLPSVRRTSRWNPGDSFVVSEFSSSHLHPLLRKTARARCVVRFPKYTTFSCGENCSPQQNACVSKNLSRDPEGACTWICKVG